MSEREPVTMMDAATRLEYEFTAGVAMSKNLKGYEQGKFIGQQCPKCKKVYVPSRGSCPTDGVATDEIVELPNTGTMTTYCVVNVPFAGQSIEIPYICGQIRRTRCRRGCGCGRSSDPRQNESVMSGTSNASSPRGARRE